MRLYLLVALALVSALLASAAHAQSTQPAGNGYDHGMTGGHMMAGHMMGGRMMAGHMMGGRMMAGHMMGGRMMGGRGAAMAAASESSAVDVMQAEDGAQDAVQTGAPAGFSTTLQSADPQRGRELAASAGCLGCHSLTPRQRTVGPTWYNLAETAENRVPGQSAEAYLYTSIVSPNAHVVQGYQPNIMVQTYGQALADDEIADLVSYLLTLHEQE